MNSSSGADVQKIGATGIELVRPLTAEFVRSFKQGITFQIWLPPQSRLRSFCRSKRPPCGFPVNIPSRLSQVMAKFKTHERPIDEIRR
jgi:hypothetical protein